MNEFFRQNQSEIKAFIKYLDKYLDDSKYDAIIEGAYKTKVSLVSAYLVELVEKKALGDHAVIAINHIGDQALSVIRSTKDRTKEELETDVDTLMNFLGQVAQELLLRNERYGSKAGAALLNYFYFYPEKTDDETYLSVYFAGKLPLAVYDQIISSKQEGANHSLKELHAKLEEVNRDIGKLDTTKDQVTKMAQELSRQKVSFNFLGLAAAFNQFYKTKRMERFLSFLMMCIVALLLVTVPICSLYKAVYDNKLQKRASEVNSDILKLQASLKGSKAPMSKDKVQAISDLESMHKSLEKDILIQYALFAIPVITIEIILLYFFRIAFQSYSNAKSQIMQLQLRNSVCQFIEQYVKFKEEHKELASSFEKFESLVFSGLAPNDDKVPSTFDGLEQFTKFIKDIKGSG